VRLRRCALTICQKYNTPLYDLKVDSKSKYFCLKMSSSHLSLNSRVPFSVNAELDATQQFEWMNMKTDEDEHSIEMHLPYIAKVMEE
jgi:MEMO1 family protein